MVRLRANCVVVSIAWGADLLHPDRHARVSRRRVRRRAGDRSFRRGQCHGVALVRRQQREVVPTRDARFDASHGRGGTGAYPRLPSRYVSASTRRGVPPSSTRPSTGTVGAHATPVYCMCARDTADGARDTADGARWGGGGGSCSPRRRARDTADGRWGGGGSCSSRVDGRATPSAGRGGGSCSSRVDGARHRRRGAWGGSCSSRVDGARDTADGARG